MASSAYFIRHGDTTWSKSGRHTGRTEIALSAEGEQKARRLGPRLAAIKFTQVLSSPRQRARMTCELAGLGGEAAADPDLAEWDYGDYEGLTSAEILKLRPGWNLFRDGCPGGESPEQVSARADRLISRVRAWQGEVALFSHGHFGRVIAVRWVGLPAGDGEFLLLDPASVSIFSYEHGNPAAPVIALWNEVPR
jgi:probable phosphoglycerate mutase